MRKLGSEFRKAVGACPALTLQNGLQALGGDRNIIKPKDTRSLTGSVNIDECLKQSHPNDNRWDYAIGYRGHNGTEKAYFIEVHPAQTSEIKCVIEKARNLRKWAEVNASALWNMTIPREIHWVASGGYNISPNDRRLLKLKEERISSPQRELVLA